MAESHVVAALVSKRAELPGLIEHHQKEKRRLADDLAHLDATLKLFFPEIDLRTIHSRAHQMPSRFFRPGECQRMVLDIFREAQGAALSSRQIGEALTARRGLEPTTVMTLPDIYSHRMSGYALRANPTYTCVPDQRLRCLGSKRTIARPSVVFFGCAFQACP